MPEWQVLSARLSVFLVPATEVPSTLWRDIVGEEPESSVFQRPTATRAETGPFAEGKLTLQSQPMRIDWAHEPVGFPSDGPPQVLGSFPGAAEPILEVGHRWMRSAWFPRTPRMALGFILISGVPDRATGYQELGKFVDGVPSSDDATDFLYQVNRPRASRAGVEGLHLNRLSKWSVGGHQVVTITAVRPTLGDLRYDLRLELDINTAPDFEGPIPQQKVESVIDDLLDGAREIAEQGNRF